MTTQPSLFDPIATKTRDVELAAQLDKEIATLAESLQRAEEWLKDTPENHPLRQKGEARYWQLVDEHARKVVTRENRHALRCVILQLPPGVRFQPTGSETAFEQLRVLFNGQPGRPDEVTLAGFTEFVKTIGWINGTTGAV